MGLALRDLQDRYDYRTDSFDESEAKEAWIQNRIGQLAKDPDMIYQALAAVSVKSVYGVYRATSADYISKLSAFAEEIDAELRLIAESEYGVKK